MAPQSRFEYFRAIFPHVKIMCDILEKIIILIPSPVILRRVFWLILGRFCFICDLEKLNEGLSIGAGELVFEVARDVACSRSS